MNKALINWWQGGLYQASDSDAAAFLLAASITDNTQRQAVDVLVRGLKTDSIWTPLKAIYPMVGGAEASHKYNLKDPRDLDAAYRLAFTGGWTHSSTGAQPNGTTGYANTFFNASTNFSVSNGSMGYYSRTNNNTGAQYDLGCSTGADGLNTIIISRYSNGLLYANFGSTPLNCSVATANSLGLTSGSRASATNSAAYRNGVSVVNIADGAIPQNLNIFLAANNKGGAAAYFSTRQCAFAFLGDTLSDTAQGNLYTRIQTFQTSLGRQV